MMKINVHNLRLGHATNSSSSHSIVVAPKNYKYMPKSKDIQFGDYEFGWEQFILADPESKKRYMAAQIYGSLVSNDINDDIAKATIRDWFSLDDIDEGTRLAVDHQSMLSFPREHITKKFADDINSFISDDRVVIYGGNDNGGYMEIPSNFENVEFLDLITDVGHGEHMIIKNDGKFWVFYNRLSGNKARFSFDIDDMDAKNYAKASTPELVDIKITDYCPFGCEFCYQASTKEGLHANLAKLQTIAYVLSEAQTFEVALGGGEPTMHPDFITILEEFDDLGITPNFTTFSKAWLKDRDTVEAVRKHVGGIGVSLHKLSDIRKIEDIASVINGSEDRFHRTSWAPDQTSIMGQHVLGSCPLDETVELINEVWQRRIPVLLLGYKDVGFGANYAPHDMTGIEVALKLLLENEDNRGCVTLSVDTAVLQQYPELCDYLGVSEILTTSEEGKFSMYIDAVNDKMAKSSYVENDEYFKASNKYGGWSLNDLKEKFATW